MTAKKGLYWPGIGLVVLVLAASLGFAAWTVSEWVTLQRAETHEATVTDVRYPAVRTDSNKGEVFVEFSLEGGELHNAEMRTRLFWAPHDGDRIDVYQRSNGGWKATQEWSWPFNVLILLACLLPWVLLYFVVDDKITKRHDRTRHSQARREAREAREET